jgi:hypothetical protein
MLVARKAMRRGAYLGHLRGAEPLVNPIRAGSRWDLYAEEDRDG